MATLYGKSAELIEALKTALDRGEPLLDLAPRALEMGLGLMQQSAEALDRVTVTLVRCDRVLDRVEHLLVAGIALADVAQQNARLEQRKLELEIKRLEAQPT